MKNQRVILLFVCCMGGFLLVLCRAAYLQVFPDERLSELKTRQYETTITLRSRRGAIFDRGGKELAVSIRADSLFADPSEIEKPKAVAKTVAKILKMDSSEIYKKISDESKRFVWLQRQLQPELVQKVKSLKIRGLGFIEESQRVYPNGRLAASTLGFVGREGNGLAGIESRFDKELAGQTKRISLPRDARGRPLLLSGHVLAENLDGADIELTLDHELQFVLERELQAAQQNFSAQGAWGIILDPATGEILAMAQQPGFHPQTPQSFGEGIRKNRLITDVYEPASVLKSFVVASALEQKTIAVNSKFDCENGRMTIGNRVIREAEAKEKFGFLSVSEILAFSSNVGSVKIAQTLAPEGLRNGLMNFGFGQKTQIDLQGESRGILHELPWRPHHFANIAFGHGVSVTALQIVMAYAAIANGGHLLKPYLVRSVKDPNSGRTQFAQTQVLRRAISKETADKMKILLTGSTADGATGVKARVAGYPVAGKTGTAQKVDETGLGYKKGAYISSFAGFVPAQDPRFVIYIVIDEPLKEYYGASVAAPVFSRVATVALRKAQVPPVLITENDIIPTQSEVIVKGARKAVAVKNSEDVQEISENSLREFGPGTMPDLTGLTVRTAVRALKERGIDVRIIGEGAIVRNSWPEPSQSLPKEMPITLFLEDQISL